MKLLRTPTLLTLALLAFFAPPLAGQSGRDRARNLDFEALDFRPPQIQNRTLSSGVSVIFLRDPSLPLVTLYARFKGGYALLPRDLYAAGTALPGLLRSGGTSKLPPDSVDHLMDFYALQTVFGGGGQSTFSSVNTLTKHLQPVVDLWGQILRSPRFDAGEMEVWRGRQLESIRRRTDDPGGLAFAEFNRIMFGDHPIGWEMEEEDLDPVRFNLQALREAHSRIFCPDNLIMGAVGDIRWSELEPLLEEMLAGWEGCSAPLPEPKVPEMREGPQVFLIPRSVQQSTVVMGQAGGVSQGSGETFYSSRIGNSILGAGGFSSRLMSRIRSERGWAYNASSLWTAPTRHQGIVGAVTQTKGASTIAATRLILETMEEMTREAPTREEVELAIARIVNGFVFNFRDPGQIVSRQMFYAAAGLPEDWLQEYLAGIQRVEPRDVLTAFRDHVEPEKMVILILGDLEGFDEDPEVLGEVWVWDVEEGRARKAESPSAR